MVILIIIGPKYREVDEIIQFICILESQEVKCSIGSFYTRRCNMPQCNIPRWLERNHYETVCRQIFVKLTKYILNKSINATVNIFIFSFFYLFISIDFDSPGVLVKNKNIFHNYTVFHYFNFLFFFNVYWTYWMFLNMCKHNKINTQIYFGTVPSIKGKNHPIPNKIWQEATVVPFAVDLSWSAYQ